MWSRADNVRGLKRDTEARGYEGRRKKGKDEPARQGKLRVASAKGHRMLRGFRDLDFYEDAYQLALEVHRLSLTLPPWERSELGSQMRRASKSIPAAIAEGWGRREYPREFKHYLAIAVGSGEEMTVHLDFSRDLGYLAPAEHLRMSAAYASIIRRLVAFSKRWQ